MSFDRNWLSPDVNELTFKGTIFPFVTLLNIFCAAFHVTFDCNIL